jgi:peptidase E
MVLRQNCTLVRRFLTETISYKLRNLNSTVKQFSVGVLRTTVQHIKTFLTIASAFIISGKNSLFLMKLLQITIFLDGINFVIISGYLYNQDKRLKLQPTYSSYK